ncbi:hypothetical protein FEM48_Zijuj04G0153900 [Ziziphus jujuba var. spinosa]|uniref:Uncharacterized protein n=1 Tax=Ziziphus jujuba var. spinosa TaxID=714518 RepID=A0A978VKM8_ZIZJJ|nr:hypothetical protein FEM48_Zijuj04G0153900 [Ziziphus jujuba var. spinosa]
MLERDDSVLDWRDYFYRHTLSLSRRDPSRWPHFPADYRQVVAEYSDRIGLLSRDVLGLVSESLGLPTICIEEVVGELYQNITTCYSPPCPQPELTLAANISLFSLFDWWMISKIITNGKYRSSQHRALTNSSRARLSMATFPDPAKARRVSPCSQPINDSSPSRYREAVYGEYLT